MVLAGVGGFSTGFKNALHDALIHCRTKVDLPLDDLSDSAEQIVRGLLFHNITSSPGQDRPFRIEQLIMLGEDEDSEVWEL